jgi:GNAT superfamily N-acetyltransferase
VTKPPAVTIELATPTGVTLAEYGSIPISFEVREVMDVQVAESSAGIHLAPHSVATPYVKDYDSGTNEGPTGWPLRFDLSPWILVLARSDGLAIGGAAVACRTPALTQLEGRDDLAVLWDLRVRPGVRRRGVGTALFAAAEAWARDRGYGQLKVETQNINAPACSFYARQGCVLRSARHGAYGDCPDEVQLLWYKDLSPRMGSQDCFGPLAPRNE